MKKNSIVGWKVAAAMIGFVAAQAVHGAVGNTPGSAAVAQNGSASFSVPIFAPPGTHGMTPGLSLSYSSGVGSGWIGQGWFIGGLSSIQRCSKTWAQDGAPRNVLLDLNDRYCLDGNRLRTVSGAHGASGTEYRTEIETFTRVKSMGAAGDGPAYFTAEMKNGLIYEFGNSTSSRIEAQGSSTARAWMVSTIRDRDGNAILFEYIEEPLSGSYRLDNVQYTSNPNQGLSAAYKIQFSYEPQPADEVDVAYWAGRIVQDTKRLTHVDVTYGSSLVRRYNVTYEPTLSNTSKSRVQSVQECAGSQGTDCFPATTFAYQNGTVGVDAPVSTGVTASTSRWITDVNGDGKDDIVYSSGASGAGTWMIMFGSVNGYTTPVDTGITNTNYSQAIKIDYNADGLGDMLVPYSGGTWWVLHGTASGFSVPGNTGAPVTATGVGNNARALDINGDGLQDLVWADLVGFDGGDAVRYRLRVWGGAFSSTANDLFAPLAANSMISNPVWDIASGSIQNEPDFNGDGRDDFLYQRIDRVFVDGTPSFWQSTYYTVAVSPAATSTSYVTTSANFPRAYGDFNGDGFTDLVYLTSATGSRMRFGTGAGFSVDTSAAQIPEGRRISYDWDQDGFDDALSRNPSTGVWSVVRSNGLSFQSAVSSGMTSDDLMTSDINGDGLLDLTYSSGGTWYYQLHSGVRPDLLKTVTDAWGNVTTFFYTSLAQGSYTKDSGAQFPEQDYAGSLAVVSHVTAPNGIGDSYTRSYWYYGARTHLQGRGFEGFSVQRVHDSRNGIYAYQYVHRLFPYTGLVYRSRLYQPNNTTLISDAEQTWASQSYNAGSEGRVLPYVSAGTEKQYAVGLAPYNGGLMSTTSVVNQFHAPTGTIYNRTTTVTEASTANGVLANTSYVSQLYFQTDHLTNATAAGEWCIGRPGMIESINSHGDYGGSQLTRTTQIDWDTKCRPVVITNEPGDSGLQVTRSLGYDDFGNVDSETIAGIDMTARTTTYNWGTSGQFPEWTMNAGSHLTDINWDYRHGVPSSVTDPNGITTSWLYDDFGRRRRENRPDHTYTLWSIESTSGLSCDPRAKYYVQEVPYTSLGQGIVQHYTFHDAFDRPINEYRGSFAGGGAYDTTVRTYDALGRVYKEGIPYISGGCSSHTLTSPTEYQYDLVGRPTQISRPVSDSNPNLKATHIYYEGLTTRVVDALNKETLKTTNVLGALVRSADNNGYAQKFAYDAFGNVVRVLDSLNNTLQSNVYNVRGMLTSQTDMDRGAWTFAPNALGELRIQTDANGIVTTFDYDPLGRPISRVTPDGGHNIVTRFMWGNSAQDNNIGRIAWINIGGSTITDNRETYSYDDYGRLTQTIYSGAGIQHYVDRTYDDATGFPETLTYPQSTSGYRLQLKYEYQAGRLVRVKDANSLSTVFWQANAVDARGNVIDEVLGNGIQTIRGYDLVTGLLDGLESGPNGSVQNLKYTWDRVGNLEEREDVRQGGLKEHFYYDDLHRLDRSTLNGVDNLDMSYDAMGNIQSKTGVGTYTYHLTKKHAVVSVGSHAFTYDNNGNQVTRDGLAVTWYPFNLPKHISAAGNNSSTFMYNVHDLRWSQSAVYGGSSETTTYIGGLMEIVVRGGVTAYRHYVSGGTGTVAEYIRDTTGLSVTRYITKDHLGSPDAITDSSGAVVVRMSHDAFGNGRNEAGWSGAVPDTDMGDIAAHTRRGFTEHDMLDNLRLVHMNGRVFDPVIGRFISADPIIDGPRTTQGWNRYSYVKNAPLSFTDPTGFECYALCQPEEPWNRERDDTGWKRRGEGRVPLGNAGVRSYDFSGAFSETGRDGMRGVDRPDISQLALDPRLRQQNYENLQHARVAAEVYRGAIFDRSQFMDQINREYGQETGAREHLSLPSAPSRSSVGGNSWGQTIINSTVPGAYYAGQAELAFRDARYGLGVAHSAASLLEAGIGFFTLGRSTAALSATRSGSAVARVRHHTSPEGLASIRQQSAINPSRGGGVHVETQPFGSARTASQETGAFGRGAYVEFDAPGGIIPTNVGPRSTGVIPTSSPLPLQGTNPSFVTRPWWRFWGD